MKMKGPFLPSKQLLVFNGAYVLIAVVRSLHSAADFSGINLQSISFSCTGKYVATGGFYFRHAHPDVQIDLSDLDNLTLQEYDRLCGVERRYFTVRETAHKRQAYEERRKEFRKFCKQRDLEEKENEK